MDILVVGFTFQIVQKKVNMYSREPPRMERYMFLACVSMGKTKYYPPGTSDKTLLREPVGYNSVRGNMTGHDEYVVYDNNRVLLKYVITYKVNPSIAWQESFESSRTLFMRANPGTALPPHLSSLVNYICHSLSAQGITLMPPIQSLQPSRTTGLPMALTTVNAQTSTLVQTTQTSSVPPPTRQFRTGTRQSERIKKQKDESKK